MIRLIALIIGYIFGLFETGILYGKGQGIDITKKGSGNSGATNSLRVMGFKAGLLVFIGDFMKAVIPCLLVFFFTRKTQPEMAMLYLIYAGLGAVLGHDFPVHLGFKGGKGIATTFGIYVSCIFPWSLVIVAVFLLIVYFTEYFSVASLVVMTLGTAILIWKAFTAFGFVSTAVSIEFSCIAVFICLLAFWKHKPNIMRLMAGNENKTALFKKRRS